MIRAWLTSLIDRILPINPDPAAFGQPQLSSMAFLTHARLREQDVPPEIKAAGGFCVRLEAAFPFGHDQFQLVGPLLAFVVTPVGQERSEARVFSPLGLSFESRDVRHRMAQEFKRAWPDVEVYTDDMPWWFVRSFDRRKLFEAIATRGVGGEVHAAAGDRARDVVPAGDCGPHPQMSSG
jgi:hypothetical protein